MELGDRVLDRLSFSRQKTLAHHKQVIFKLIELLGTQITPLIPWWGFKMFKNVS
ncbi:hypothetical protein FDUTEX481_04262 [Tolypothrix sp. PCC 7601]|nr:hypothetical protein FDUTEX481_04262 [Tolypothrix sp. PCC 7601]